MAKKALIRRAFDDPVSIMAQAGHQDIVLQKNMTFRASGYGIDNVGTWPEGSSVDIDLNGYTLTFCAGVVNTQDTIYTLNSSQGPGNMGHAAILSPKRPDSTEDFPGLFTFNPQANYPTLRIFGPGTIRSGGGANAWYCDAIRLGFPFECFNITFDVDILDSRVIKGNHEATVHDCVIYHRNTLTNRHSIRGAVELDDDGIVYNCSITTNNQCGIYLDQRGQAYDNTISMDVVETNAYGIVQTEAAAENCVVYDNTVTATDGRGARFCGDNNKAYNLTIDVNRKGNDEYPVQETHGIKLENNVIGLRVWNCNVVARGNQDGGSGSALNVDMSDFLGTLALDSIVEGCQFEILGDHESIVNGALFFIENERGQELTIRNCVFRTNAHSVCVNGTCNHSSAHRSTFVATGSETFWIFYDFNKDSTNTRLVDCSFYNCDPRTKQHVDNSGPNLGNVDYHIQWSVHLPGAGGMTATVTDAHGTVLLDNEYIPPGDERLEVSEYTYERDSSATVTETEHSPVTVTLAGESYTLELTEPRTVARAKMPLSILGAVAT